MKVRDDKAEVEEEADEEEEEEDSHITTLMPSSVWVVCWS